MEIQDFIQHFAAQFDETNATEFNTTTEFRKLTEWDSLIAMSVIAMVDEEYNVKLTGDDIRKSKTVKDIFEIVITKK